MRQVEGAVSNDRRYNLKNEPWYCASDTELQSEGITQHCRNVRHNEHHSEYDEEVVLITAINLD